MRSCWVSDGVSWMKTWAFWVVAACFLRLPLRRVDILVFYPSRVYGKVKSGLGVSAYGKLVGSSDFAVFF